jgi:mono/diheme cytochrome c family protein
MRGPVVLLALALAALAILASGLPRLLAATPPDAARTARQWDDLCASCHGADGRGSWRAWLFMIRPGNLADAAQMRSYSDRYLFDLIKYGGSPIGRPGMPAFGEALSDAEIEALVRYIRALPSARR